MKKQPDLTQQAKWDLAEMLVELAESYRKGDEHDKAIAKEFDVLLGECAIIKERKLGGGR